jgi:hypothetical protein
MDRKRAAHAPELRAVRFAAVETNLSQAVVRGVLVAKGFAAGKVGYSSRIAEVRLPSPWKGADNSE